MAHDFFLSCSFYYLEQDLWHIFRDACESEKHIIIIDPCTCTLFLDDLKNTIVIYKGD